MSTTRAPRPLPPSALLNGALWLVQALLGLTFVGTALWKVFTPIPELAAKMPWMGQVSPAFLYLTALLDFLGGTFVLVPSLVRVRPGLSVLAALGCTALMAGAIAFHFSRGEAASTPFNFVLAGLSSFVAWGRHRRAALAPRANLDVNRDAA